MKIVTVVGARPQFIKAAAVSRVLREKHEELIIHTGQHYDENMSNIFFDELKIPYPNFNLNVGSGTHAKQTAEMMIGIEKLLLDLTPDAVLVYGDTNSTLAAALSASKILIPIIHVEAGLRSFNMAMPEEQNRILTDRLSKFLFCPTGTAVKNLQNEGIINNVYDVGDVMCDAVMYYSKFLENHSLEKYTSKLNLIFNANKDILTKGWYLSTLLRAENTDTQSKIEEILSAFEELDKVVIFPVHPRTKGIVDSLFKSRAYQNILFVEPLGYLDMLYFAKNANKIITDSGGLQKEAYLLETPCVTVRDQTEWVETLRGNHNILAKPQKEDIVSKVLDTVIDFSNRENYYGVGDAAKKILNYI